MRMQDLRLENVLYEIDDEYLRQSYYGAISIWMLSHADMQTEWALRLMAGERGRKEEERYTLLRQFTSWMSFGTRNFNWNVRPVYDE